MKFYTIKIGRDPVNDIVVSDKAAEFYHAEIHYNGEKEWKIFDLNTKLGVWVNQIKINDSCKLNYGDEIRIGFQTLDWSKIESKIKVSEENQNKASIFPSKEKHANDEKKENDLNENTKKLKINADAPNQQVNQHSGEADMPVHKSVTKLEINSSQVRVVKGTSLSFVESQRLKKKQNKPWQTIALAFFIVLLMLLSGYFLSQLLN